MTFRQYLTFLPRPFALLALFTIPVSAQEPNFGRTVAMTPDDLFIGQPVNWYGPGVVYAYRADADGGWSDPTLLTAPDSARKDDFGGALAVDGNTLVVGAPRKRDGSGVAYVFERASVDDAWRHASTLEAPAAGEHDEFAIAVALAGDNLLIGSPETAGTGVIYHFTRADDGWAMRTTIAPAAGDGATDFGRTLSFQDDRVLVGAPAADSRAGRAYLVTRTAAGAWSAPARLALPTVDGSSAPEAGGAVLLAGDDAFVGASRGASVLVLSANASGGLSVAGMLHPSDDARGSRFGSALALADGELWVGAPGFAGRDGRVYRFTRGADGDWAATGHVDPDDTSGERWRLGFGHAIAANDGRVAVGMPTRDFGEGRALTFARAGDGWQPADLLEGRIFRLGQDLTTGDRCEDGRMAEFPCESMELVAHMPISELGGERGVWVNDVWGWSDPETGRNYALVARRDGASFVDVTEPAAPRLVGNLPRTSGSRPSVWRDIKVIGTHAFIVSDGAGQHGMQVFDLTRLRQVGDSPVEFEPETTYHEIASAHNVVADTASGFVYVVGANSGGQTCGGGLHMVDVRNPTNPTFAGCYHDPSATSRGYTHDAQCLVYDGPDADYQGRQICVGSNASEMNIADVTDKANPRTVSRATYPNVSYTHQGWFDDERRYFYMNDESDETAGVVDRTRTMVWDLTDLDDPILVNQYFGPVAASDHNLFVTGDRMYQSNYGSGLRVIDISDRANPQEIAYFDSAPLNNNEPGHSSSQSGAWSNYPFFPGGFVVFTSVREGLFIMRVVDRPIT